VTPSSLASSGLVRGRAISSRPPPSHSTIASLIGGAPHQSPLAHSHNPAPLPHACNSSTPHSHSHSPPQHNLTSVPRASAELLAKLPRRTAVAGCERETERESDGDGDGSSALSATLPWPYAPPRQEPLRNFIALRVCPFQCLSVSPIASYCKTLGFY
jgi:hypothetical protein